MERIETENTKLRDGRHRRVETTRSKILAAAHDIALAGNALTMAAIARRAGVSIRSVFQHFKSARELGEEIVDQFPDIGDLIHERMLRCRDQKMASRNLARLYLLRELPPDKG